MLGSLAFTQCLTFTHHRIFQEKKEKSAKKSEKKEKKEKKSKKGD